MDGPPLPGTLRENEISRDRLKKVSETGVSLRRGPVWGTSTGNFERLWKEGSGNGASLSLWELCYGNLEEGLL
jgi:hypothetical protein